ncbi:hypothetical protein Poly30_04390 [Planctomycetes bacterium Poly30]|uniref:FG-GAP repeat protein n=1 Tax=Saltatorellus ferox TaxID=2528018 RepID=A0A518ELH7_9BACT|nr:hypothetical protein Poly30_04390 [Planctomycetes bacterium Poly30]
MNSSHLFPAALAIACVTSHLPLASGLQGTVELPVGVNDGDWARIQSLLVAERHGFQATAFGHVASNPGLHSTARFDGRSALIEVTGRDERFGLALHSYGFTGHAVSVDVPMFGACADGQELTYGWSDELSEWWINDARGFEHGFSVWERPTSAAPECHRGPLRFTLDILGTLTPEVNAARKGLALRRADGTLALCYDGLLAVDAEGVVLDSWLEVEGTKLSLCVEEAGAAYPLVIDPIVQEAYLKASNTEALDFFGTCVAVSGDTVVVGAPAEDSGATGVNGDESDNSVDGSGAAYVYIRSGGIWSQQAYLKASNTGVLDNFGRSVAVSGDTVVVGADREGSSATGVNGDGSDDSASLSGAAYVFVRSGGSWSQQAYLKASNAEAFDLFGGSVAVSGDTVVVGARNEGSGATGVNGDGSNNAVGFSGAAYVFVRSAGSWSQQAYLKASNTGTGDAFGAAVAVSGDTVAVGAGAEDSSATGVNGDGSDNLVLNSGAGYVFVRSGVSWSQQAYLKASNAEASDFFGGSVAVSGETLVIGAVGEDSEATGVDGDESDNSAAASGAAYVFIRSGASWTQQAYLKASNTEAFDDFGESVAVACDTVVVGTKEESSSAIGVNGDGSDNSAPLSGAAYVFVRLDDLWSQQAYLKASNTESYDFFGTSVGVSDGTVLVGAERESSSATGVNGDPSSNSALRAGAAYLWSGLVSPGIGDLVCVGTPNSTGFGGTLSASGSPVVTSNSLALEVACCPAGVLGLVLTSSSYGGQVQTVSLGEGSLCIANFRLARFPVLMTDQNGAATQVVDLTAIPTNLFGATAALPGDTFYFQYWHRDAAVGAPTSNLSSALSVLFE